MKRVLGSVSCLSLAFLIACAAEEAAPGDTQPDAMGGSGAAAGRGGGGSGAAGGSTGGTGVGGTGPATGGTGQAGLPGTGGAVATGGTGTAGSGGTTGGAAGAGNAGGQPPGSGGSATGGSSEPGSGGSALGGSGGEPPLAGSGGEPPLGGAGGSGGTPPVLDEPELVTSAQNAYWQEGTLTEVTSGNAEVTVNDTSAAQTFTGFGGTFNEKGWEALGALSQADRDTAIKLLFDATDGAKFVYGRIPIGASDYASDRYTLNETANDAMQTNFSIDRDKQKLIPYIKAALVVNPDIHFWGSPWTPPRWMKDNNAYDKGNMRNDATVLSSYAIYLAKFVEEYGKEGIAVKAIHPQNEPGYSQDYPSCLWSGSLMATFIGQHLGPTFQQRGVAAEIFIGTMSNDQTDASVVSSVMGNAAAKAFIKGYGLQWNMINVYSNLNMDRNLAIWQTEHKCGNYPWVSGTNQSRAPNDHAYGVESWGLIRDWIKRGVTSYSAWNMVLDTIGRSLDTVRPWAQNALLAVDTGQKRLVITPAYYVFRHISQYVDPGAKVVGTSGGDALAFKNPDGDIVAILYNSGGAKMTTVAIGGKKFQFNMPGSGWATVNFRP